MFQNIINICNNRILYVPLQCTTSNFNLYLSFSYRKVPICEDRHFFVVSFLFTYFTSVSYAACSRAQYTLGPKIFVPTLTIVLPQSTAMG